MGMGMGMAMAMAMAMAMGMGWDGGRCGVAVRCVALARGDGGGRLDRASSIDPA